MCVYQRKLNAKPVTLLYPKPEGDVESIRKEYKSDDGVIVHVDFVNLVNLDGSLAQLAWLLQPFAYTPHYSAF